MTQSSFANKTLAPLTNVYNLSTLVERLVDRDQGLPGMGCFFGPSGFGKTMASTFSALEHGAIVVEMGDSWTKGTLVSMILTELGQTPRGTVADKVMAICAALAERGSPLIIDEADYLLKRQMIETAREIHDKSDVPVILIGEELLPQKLKEFERVHGRILSHVAAEPCNDDDFALLRDLRCREIRISEDLQHKIKAKSRGSARRIVENLAHVREIAARDGLSTVALSHWGHEPFFEGQAPQPRRDVA